MYTVIADVTWNTQVRDILVLFLIIILYVCNVHIEKFAAITSYRYRGFTACSSRDATVSLSSSIRLFVLAGWNFFLTVTKHFGRRTFDAHIRYSSLIGKMRTCVFACSATWRMTNYVETTGLGRPEWRRAGAPGMLIAPRGAPTGEFELHGPPLVTVRYKTKRMPSCRGSWFTLQTASSNTHTSDLASPSRSSLGWRRFFRLLSPPAVSSCKLPK